MTLSPLSPAVKLHFLNSRPAVPPAPAAPHPAATAPGVTFAERFCAAQGIAPERYADAMLRRTLYPHARWLAWLLPRGHFAPDREFIAALGPLRRASEFRDEILSHRDHPENRGWLRRTLRLRVSLGEARRLFIATLTAR